MKVSNVAAPEAKEDQPGKTAPRLLDIVSGGWSWLFLLILIIFFSITGQGFLNIFNFQNIGADMSLVLIMALGQTFVILSGGIDLSVGFVMGMASVAAALVMSRMGGSAPLFVVVLAGLAVGLGVGFIPGLVNGLIIARLRVPPFIVTLGMYGMARGAGFILSGGQPVSIQTNGIGQIGNAYLLYLLPDGRVSFFHLPSNLEGVRPSQIVQLLPFPLILLIVVVLICAWVLSQTRFGRHTYAVGGSEEAARRAGIPVARHTILIYVLSALMASLAGVLYTLRFSNGAADVGDPLLLTSIAAVIIGGASLFGGEGTILGTVIGALIIAIIQNGLIFLEINPFWQFIAVGAVIILAVLVDQAKKQLI
ncbi:MAG TPA: ABC transporter permease [Ktedonobacteraceae bacterium]|jgi:ribose/xylose/arabinose/galactoside ABC-type transport system permease subunit|nr:ABC transporter permease [Ktedonobacteraceae bacterium]